MPRSATENKENKLSFVVSVAGHGFLRSFGGKNHIKMMEIKTNNAAKLDINSLIWTIFWDIPVAWIPLPRNQNFAMYTLDIHGHLRQLEAGILWMWMSNVILFSVLLLLTNFSTTTTITNTDTNSSTDINTSTTATATTTTTTTTSLSSSVSVLARFDFMLIGVM